MIEPPTLKKINSRDIKDEITAQLVRLITSLDPGTRLPPERELSEMLNVSRSSVREAVRSLEFVGAIRVKQGDGIYVADAANGDLERLIGLGIVLQRSNVQEIIETRQMLEVDVAELAAKRYTARNRTALENVMADLKEGINDADKVVGFDLEFHVALAQATHNSVLIHFVNGMRAIIRSWIENKITHAGDRGEVIAEIVTEHEAILRAVFDRDSSAAAQQMHDHMEHSAKRLTSVMASNQGARDQLLSWLAKDSS